jgi:CcmD family protein
VSASASGSRLEVPRIRGVRLQPVCWYVGSGFSRTCIEQEMTMRTMMSVSSGLGAWLAVGVVVAAFSGPAWASSTQQPNQPPSMTQAQPVPEGFERVGDQPGQERLPATPFVLYAYGFVWVMILAYLWSLWRRLATVEKELADVTRRVEGGGRRA